MVTQLMPIGAGDGTGEGWGDGMGLGMGLGLGEGTGTGCGVGVGVGVGKSGKLKGGKLKVGKVKSKPAAATSGCWSPEVGAGVLAGVEAVTLTLFSRVRERRPWAILGLRPPRYSLENCLGLRCEKRLPEAL